MSARQRLLHLLDDLIDMGGVGPAVELIRHHLSVLWKACKQNGSCYRFLLSIASKHIPTCSVTLEPW